MSDNDTKTFRDIFFDAEFRVGQGIASAFDLDQAAFDAAETIGEVAASETAMDAVAASETAREAVRASSVAFEAVGSSNLAIGKFVAGEAGLDPAEFADMDAVVASETAMDAVAVSETAMGAVAASETAMDAVAASETAMDVVAASPLAVREFLASGFIVEAVWSKTSASEKLLDRWGEEPLPVVKDTVDFDALERPLDGGRSLGVFNNDLDEERNTVREIGINLSGIKEMRVRVNRDNGNPNGLDVGVSIDDERVFGVGNDEPDFDEFDIDVASFDGVHDVGIGYAMSAATINERSQGEDLIGDVKLVKA